MGLNTTKLTSAIACHNDLKYLRSGIWRCRYSYFLHSSEVHMCSATDDPIVTNQFCRQLHCRQLSSSALYITRVSGDDTSLREGEREDALCQGFFNRVL